MNKSFFMVGGTLVVLLIIFSLLGGIYSSQIKFQSQTTEIIDRITIKIDSLENIVNSKKDSIIINVVPQTIQVYK